MGDGATVGDVLGPGDGAPDGAGEAEGDGDDPGCGDADDAGDGAAVDDGTGGGGGGGIPCARAASGAASSASAAAPARAARETCEAVVVDGMVSPKTTDGDANVARVLAPGGALRAAINFGNPVLAQRDPDGAEPQGVSAALARELARRLGVPLAFVTFDGAGKVTDALREDAWDVAFLAVDPVRAGTIAFSPPYVIIEGTYLVPRDSAFSSVDDVDRDGVRIAVARGSAYDLHLTRTVERAQLVRYGSGEESLAAFAAGGLDAAGGVRQPLAAFARTHPGVRVLDGRFMTIEQAVAIPKTRAAAAPFVRSFVEEMKRSGFVARALAASGQHDAVVAPPASQTDEPSAG